MVEQIEDTINEISKKSGKSNEEVNALIEAKIKKFSGLLTKQGATFMVGKELGVKSEASVDAKITDLTDGMKDVTIKGIIKNIYPTKEFEKEGKKGKLSSFLLDDTTGLVRVTLWNDQVDKYNLTIGSEIQINNSVVSSYNEKQQLSLGFNGTIDILNKKEEVFEKISDLKSGITNANIVGRLIRKFPCKEFDSNDRKGKLCNFQFGDETALLRATAWNEKADEILNHSDGDVIEIKNAYTKDGMFGVELHLGYSAMITTSGAEVPSVTQILKDSIETKEINKLNQNENVIIGGKVSEILPGNLYFLACEKCGKKVTDHICEKCGEVDGEKRAVISAVIEDDTATIRANFFGDTALALIKLNSKEFENELENKSSEKLGQELNEKIKENNIKLFGYTKENSYSSENEFVVKEVIN